MATAFDNGVGLSQLSYYTPDKNDHGTDGPFSNLKNQTELYMAAVKGKLAESEYSDKKTYVESKDENGLGNQTTEHNYFDDQSTYVDNINKTGSEILFVDDTQTGNQDVAQVNKYDNYDAYYKRTK